MKGTRLVKENGIHMKKSCATLSGCATLGASVPIYSIGQISQMSPRECRRVGPPRCDSSIIHQVSGRAS